MHEAFRSEAAKKVQEAHERAARKKREMLGAFAQIQFAMYDAHHAEFNSHTVRKLEDELRGFLGVLEDLKKTEDHLMVTMADSVNVRTDGTAGPAELTGQGEPKAGWDDLKEAAKEMGPIKK